jgi:endonuclease YncB( thermonuclease family)
MMKAVTTLKRSRGIGLLAVVGVALSGAVLATPETATAQTIKLSIPPPPQNNVPAEVFTGTVKNFVDGETLQIERISSDGKQSGRTVLIHLYGVSAVPNAFLPRPAADKADKQERGTLASAADLRESIIGQKVRVEVRGRSKRKNDQVAQNALVSLLPDDRNAVSAPPALPQQGAPNVAIVQTRPLNDATGVNRDLPRGPSRPNLATSPNLPAPPAATAVRKDDVLNYALVREGLARWNQLEAPDVKEFAEAEKDAQKSSRGFWSDNKK